MLSTFVIAGIIAGILIGWKLRGFWERRPRIMRWGDKKKPEPTVSTPPAAGKGGIMDRASRTGEKLVGKGLELILGKPKGPKDDKEKP